MTYRSSHPGGANWGLGDGSVRSTDTSAVATLMDFDFPSSSDTHDPLVLVTDADPSAAVNTPGALLFTFDSEPVANGADYSGSHVLYQDVFIPTLDTETRIFDHEGYWY